MTESLYRNQSTELLWKPMDWFLYDRDLHHERVNPFQANVPFLYPLKTSEGFLIGGIKSKHYL